MNTLRKSKAILLLRLRLAADAERKRRRELRAAERRGYDAHKFEHTELVSAVIGYNNEVRVMKLNEPPKHPYITIDCSDNGSGVRFTRELRSKKMYMQIGSAAFVWWGWEPTRDF